MSAGEILHPELLTDTGLQATPAPYHETLDIQRSRPSSPVSAEERAKPVDVGQAVKVYIDSGHEPQVRAPSARSRPVSPAASSISDQHHAVSEEARFEEQASEPASKSTEEKPEEKHQTKTTKMKGNTENKADSLKGLNFVRENKDVKEPEPTDEEKEATRRLVSSIMARPKPPARGRLELEGIGKEGDEEEEVAPVQPPIVKPSKPEKTTNLSDLASLVQKPKPPKASKDKVGGSQPFVS